VLEKEPDYIREILRRGAEQARLVAAPLVQQVREAAGIPSTSDVRRPTSDVK
jgi:hypothetical protein